jgi:hypothetical protein
VDNKQKLKRLLSNTNALLAAMRYSTSTVSGELANIGRYSSFKMYMQRNNTLVDQVVPLLPDTTMLGRFKVEDVPGWADLTWVQAKNQFDSVYSNLSLLKSLLEDAIGYAEDQTQNLKDFVQANLRKAIHTTPEREVEIQNAVETLIVGRGMEKGTDYDRETGRVKVSGREFVPDFVFHNLTLCMEVKLSKSADTRRAIVEEINADIRAYSTAYDRQLYVIYDLGTIRDEDEFKRGLEDAPGVSVVVVKH